MSLNPFNKKKKKKIVIHEKGHREPIMVKFFKEKDPDQMTHVNVEDGENGEQAGEKTGQESGKKRHARFVPNDKYFTITVYALMAVFIATLFAVLLVNVATVTSAVKNFLFVISPFIIGGIIAFILTPIVNMLDASLFEKALKIKKPKLRAGLSIAITYIFFLGLIVLAMMKLIPELGESLSELYDKSLNLGSKIGNLFGSLQEKFPDLDLSGLVDKAKENLPTLLSNAGDFLKTSLPMIFSSAYNFVHVLINILLAVAVSIYMVCDKRRIAHASTKLVYTIMKPKTAASFIQNAKESFQIFTGFIIGKAIDSLIIGILTFIILKIFGLPYELLVAVIVGVTNMIPFFGPFIGAIPGVILYLCIDPTYALIFVFIILAIQQFDGWILGPMILGDSTGIRPIWVIFGITVGGAYFGFAGMFLGVPFTAVIVYLVNKAVDAKLNEKHIEVS